jgi:transcriptional regulator with XRE-family HTH domain
VAAVGQRVRALREGMGLSLRDLGTRSGVSAQMLSQVERGKTSPTLAVAGRIAGGLDLSLSQLLRLDEGPALVVTPAAARRAQAAVGHRWELLTPDLPGQRVAVSEHTLAAGAATAPSSSLHEPGSREVVVVQRGGVVLELDGGPHPLGAGDAAAFDSDLEHRVLNPHDEPAVFLSVVTAGLRPS